MSVQIRKRKMDEEPLQLVTNVVNELIERGVLDDETYAHWHAEQRANSASKCRSRLQLLGELSKKSVDHVIAEEALANHDELLTCASIARLALRRGCRGVKLRKYLSNKAFSSWAIGAVVQASVEEGEEGLTRLVEEQRQKRELK